MLQAGLKTSLRILPRQSFQRTGKYDTNRIVLLSHSSSCEKDRDHETLSCLYPAGYIVKSFSFFHTTETYRKYLRHEKPLREAYGGLRGYLHEFGLSFVPDWRHPGSYEIPLTVYMNLEWDVAHSGLSSFRFSFRNEISFCIEISFRSHVNTVRDFIPYWKCDWGGGLNRTTHASF